jgi:hypothetical protein
MPRYYYSGARDTVNGRKRVSIFWLRKNNYLKDDGSHYYGGISWSSDGKPTGDIRFEIDFIDANRPYINFIYRVKQQYEPVENYRDINYRFSLESIPCHFGGKRWFFRCELYKSGRYCGHCAELSYDSCNENRHYGDVLGILGKSWKAEEYYATLKRTHYRGKPTRKYRKYLKLNSISDSQWILAESAINKLLGKNRPNKT